FFFSSRRRHTRFSRDWSSDVCSSDLVLREMAMVVGIGLIAGLGLAAIGAQTIRALLYQVEPLDPAVLATVCASILGCALLVSLQIGRASCRESVESAEAGA